jgi:ribonuclease-3 family protein
MEESVKKLNPYSYSPLALAYIGDSVFDLMIKTHYVEKANKQAEKYHREVSRIVKAVTQAKVVDYLVAEELLSQEELDIYKRGRNATSHTKAKNASVIEYRKATGFEAVFGYLYLQGNTERLNQLVQLTLECTRMNFTAGARQRK